MVGEKLLLSHEPIDIDWAFNIHGHDHAGADRKNHLNCCVDASMKQFGIPYEPINMNQIMKTGLTSKVESIHRLTIDDATERKIKRGKKSWKK
jgi:calcineurin-like phosphoesterase family protein